MPHGEGFHPRGWRGSIASCIDIHRISKRTKPIQKQTCRIQQEILLGGQCEAWGLLSSHLRVVPSRGQQQELLSILEPSRSECRNSNPRQLIWDLRLPIIFTWALAGRAIGEKRAGSATQWWHVPPRIDFQYPSGGVPNVKPCRKLLLSCKDF